jgi:hypothetical protein
MAYKTIWRRKTEESQVNFISCCLRAAAAAQSGKHLASLGPLQKKPAGHATLAQNEADLEVRPTIRAASR